jgi:hypothetical protein
VHPGVARRRWIVLATALGCRAPAPQQAPEPTGAAPVPALAFLGEATCDRIVPFAPGAMQDDAQALCRATSYDLDPCESDGAREGFECLVAARAPAQLFVELARAEHPAVRSYGREGLERLDAWTPDLLREALADGAMVEQSSECGDSSFSAWRLGVLGILQSNEAFAAALLPQLLLTTSDRELVAMVLDLAGSARWMDARTLTHVATHAGLDERTRAHARSLLERRDEPPPEPNEAWGRNGACHRQLELEILRVEQRERQRAIELERKLLEQQALDLESAYTTFDTKPAAPAD